MAAVLVVRHRFPGRRALAAALQLPMLIPEVMLGLGFLILFSRIGMRAQPRQYHARACRHHACRSRYGS